MLDLICVEAVIVCTTRLLGSVRDGRVFRQSALGWVDGIIGAFGAAGGVCLAPIIHQAMTIAGPPLWLLALFGGVLGGAGLAPLVWVMRALLVEATTLRKKFEDGRAQALC